MEAAPASDSIITEILQKVHARAPKTLCPSEIARALATDRCDWRALMPLVRTEAAKLAREGKIRVTQRGHDVDATSARGPIRLGATNR
ncbi:MAG: DUF3253 domain-containing protein [Pseudomonadota bacterium]